MWNSPVQDEQLKDQIRLKLEEIATALENKPSPLSYSLINGEAGILLFDCYYSLFLDSSENSERTEQKIIAMFDNLKTVPAGILSNGVAGMVWTLDHLNKAGFIEVEQEIFADISPSLSNSLIKNSLAGNFDYLHGANGIALYLSGRTEETAHANFDHWLQLLEENGSSTEDTICWQTTINAKAGLYGYNLGLAHGICSVIIILVKRLKLQPDEQASRLLNKCINYLLENRNEKGAGSFFPGYVISGKKQNVVRPGWCYGDLGCAMALYFAGNFLKRPELVSLSEEILLFYAHNRGPLQDKEILDADFCHGAVGVAHIFARFYNYTGSEEYRKAAEYYYAKTLQLGAGNNGPAGYQHITDDGAENNYSLLEGISGIGLCLISAVSSIEPQWDNCFLLS